jgi:hypothetical protein
MHPIRSETLLWLQACLWLLQFWRRVGITRRGSLEDWQILSTA